MLMKTPRTTSITKFQDRSILLAVMEAMSVFDSIQDGAKAVGIDRDVYSFIRKLIIKRNEDISEDEKLLLDEALALVESTKKVAKARALVGAIVDSGKKNTRFAPVKIRRRFDHTLVSIRENCETTKDVVVPVNLSDEEVKKAVATLSTSILLISGLINRLIGEES